MNETRAIYLGRRISADHKLVHAFCAQSHPGQVSHFRFRRGGGWVVGGIYTTEADVVDGNLSSMMAPSEWSGERHDDRDQVMAWELLDRRAQQAHAARAAGARARRHPTYESCIARLDTVMDQARTRTEAEQIAGTVRQVLIANWHQRRRSEGPR